MPIQVLLVEDNRPDVLLIRDALQNEGLEFVIHEITDAEAAMAYVARMGIAADAPYPDVVITDLNLPRGDGLGVLRALRESPACMNTPIIVMTSSASPGDRAKVGEIGNTRYFKKPLELDAFLRIGALVRQVLSEDTAYPD
jgi:CheY-like chemotaxis protein